MAKALVIVDMQEDFVSSSGKLQVPDAYKIVPTIVGLRNWADRCGMKVIYTQDWHTERDPEFEVWPEHCVQNTVGAQIIPELRPVGLNHYTFRKCQLSAFSNLAMIDFLRENKIDEIYLCGVATEYCVHVFAVDARKYGIGVNLVVDAIKGVDGITEIPDTQGCVVGAAIDMGNRGVRVVYSRNLVEDSESE